MPKNYFQQIPLWKLALRFGSLFLIIVIIIELVWHLFKYGNFSFITENITNGYWLTYVVSRLIIGVTYGFVMGYLTKKQAR